MTRKSLTVLTAAAKHDGGVALVDRTLQTGEVTIGSLCSALDRNSGLHGLLFARELVEVLEAGSQSVAERLFVDLLNLHQITGWVPAARPLRQTTRLRVAGAPCCPGRDGLAPAAVLVESRAL